jgi:hypothetical protein
MHKEMNALCALYCSLQIRCIGDTKFYVVVLLNDVEH